jgi:hypothetical protein
MRSGKTEAVDDEAFWAALSNLLNKCRIALGSRKNPPVSRCTNALPCLVTTQTPVVASTDLLATLVYPQTHVFLAMKHLSASPGKRFK